MDVASMDVEQMLQQTKNIGDIDDYVESAREKFENDGSVITSEESKINSYFKNFNKNSSTQKNFFDGGLKKSKNYLDLVDKINLPTLYNFFNINENFTDKDFYSFATDNFINLNEQELNFITEKFNPHKYHKVILDNVINNNHSINLSQFQSLLSQNLSDSFENIYLENIVIKYALNNFSKISQQNITQLWSKIDLAYSQDYFLQKAIEHKFHINDKKFFKNFNFQSNDLLKQYLSLAVEQQWNTTIIYFCQNFTNLSLSYLQQPKSFNTKENINFERLFLYYNPEKINESHLNDNNLNTVYSKLYEKLSSNNLLNKENIDFMRSLGFGIYKFLEICYQQRTNETIDLLENETSLFFPYHTNNTFASQNDNTRYNAFNNLLDNTEFLNQNIQDSFHKNILIHYLSSDKNNEKEMLFNYAHSNESFYMVVGNSSIINDKQRNLLIYELITSYCYEHVEKINLFKKLNCLDLNILEKFELHLDFSLSIIKNAKEYLKEEVRQQFANIILNKKKHNQLYNETEVRTEKRLKI